MALIVIDTSMVVDVYLENNELQVGLRHKFPWSQASVTLMGDKEKEVCVVLPLLYIVMQWVTFLLVVADTVMTSLQGMLVPRSWKHGLAAAISSLVLSGCRVWTSVGLLVSLGGLWDGVTCEEDCVTGAVTENGKLASDWLRR